MANAAAWYLVARTPAGFRTYRVSRIEEARLLEDPSERTAGFDLASYWKSSTEELKSSRSRYEATLRLEEDAARKVTVWRNTSEVAGELESGWVRLRIQFDDEEQARFVALGFGPRAQVIEPLSLRERVASDLAEAVRRLGVTRAESRTPRRLPARSRSTSPEEGRARET